MPCFIEHMMLLFENNWTKKNVLTIAISLCNGSFNKTIYLQNGRYCVLLYMSFKLFFYKFGQRDHNCIT